MVIDIFKMFGASFTLNLLLMLGLWIIYLVRRNAGILDMAWGIGFILAAWSYFFLGRGDFFKMLIMTLMVTLWAGRLTRHLYLRYRKSEGEGSRYQYIRQQWKAHSENLFFLMLFIFQGVLIVILSLPFFLVGFGSHSQWSMWEGWGILLWAVGVIGESFADSQLTSFLEDPENRGRVCRKGLWRFSRHPNYFFEVIVWIGFCLFAIPSNAGWLAIFSPLIMLGLLLKITGIPLTEADAIGSKGEQYRDYQRTTSLFIPWFPKK